jgi:hypothetical protein
MTRRWRDPDGVASDSTDQAVLEFARANHTCRRWGRHGQTSPVGVVRRKMTIGAIWSFHYPFSLLNYENQYLMATVSGGKKHDFIMVLVIFPS